MIRLMKADLNHCKIIHAMQAEAFRPLLDKYQDFSTNPGAESLEAVIGKMKQAGTIYYLILLDELPIGALRVVQGCESFRISPVFILPEYQGNGFAKQALLAVEAIYPDINCWKLDTIKEEKELCRFYEDLGYDTIGIEKPVKNGMTIINYEKTRALK